MMLKSQKRLVAQLIKGAKAEITKDAVLLHRAHAQPLRFEPTLAQTLLSAGVIDEKDGLLLANQCSKLWLRRVCLDDGDVDSAPQQITAPKYNPAFARLKKLTGHPFFDTHHLLAAQKFTYLFEFSGQRPHVTVHYDSFHLPKSPSGAGGLTMSERAVSARQSLDRIHDRLGADLYTMLVDICVFEKGLGRVEQERSWPRRSGKFMLKIALGQLAGHFGVQSEVKGTKSKRSQHAWRAENRLPLRQN